MCLLTFFPPGVQPDTGLLRNGTYTNDDGHGFAMIVDGKLHVRHGMNADSMIAAFASARKAHPDGPAMFHSRYGTGGGVDKTNCHPFFVRGDTDTVIAHNGVLFAPHKNENRCDTRIFAENIFPKRFQRLDRKRVMARLEKYLGKWNKIIVMTVNPRYAHQWYIVNEQDGTWHEGVWYSNDGFRPYIIGKVYAGFDDDDEWLNRYTSGKYKYYGGGSKYYGSDCDLCGSKGSVNTVTLYCNECTSCQECQSPQDECLCYTPMALDRERNTRFAVGATGETTQECSDCGGVEECQCFDRAEDIAKHSVPVGWPDDVKAKLADIAATYANK